MSVPNQQPDITSAVLAQGSAHLICSDPFRETLALRVKENFAALHAEGVLHRDVQRRHILLRPNDVPVTIDFEGAIETSDQALFEEEDRQVDRLFDLDDQE